MPFTGIGVKDAVEFYVDIPTDDKDYKTIINLGLNGLANQGIAYSEENLSGVTAETAENLSSNIVGILYVIDNNDNLYDLWEADLTSSPATITLSEGGDYQIIENKLPAKLKRIGDVIDINEIYKIALVNYVTGYIKLKYNDTAPDGMRLMAEFERLGKTAFNTLVKSRLPAQVRSMQNA